MSNSNEKKKIFEERKKILEKTIQKYINFFKKINVTDIFLELREVSNNIFRISSAELDALSETFLSIKILEDKDYSYEAIGYSNNKYGIVPRDHIIKYLEIIDIDLLLKNYFMKWIEWLLEYNYVAFFDDDNKKMLKRTNPYMGKFLSDIDSLWESVRGKILGDEN